ncbi:hypothetical protein [Shouchella shacheensis]|uniref:hypothetical protein n=1 Tax=Shouchella shacheensis TaxID=1649580 RepID=UPI000ABD8EF3|nr:hypothetical protein [Shouchella shacheensis]
MQTLLALYNVNDHKKAVQLLFRALMESSSDEWIHSYRRAITFYIDHIDEVW